MATSLVKIIDDKLVLQDDILSRDLNKKCVISIIGKARMGKSTFLNAIHAQLTNTNKNIFQTQDNDEHCTLGIDAYAVPDTNIILLDSQGLAFEDSSHDPALLLFVYLISDIVIFNERMMLQNEALKLLEPICTFVNYISMEEIFKPYLFFRISDGQMVKDPQRNLEKVLSTYTDQYQSVRDSIQHLFQQPIQLVKTDSFDKNTLKLLEADDYKSILTSDLHFQEAITPIISCIESCLKGEKKTTFKLIDVIENINNNERITCEKLDIVGLTAKTDIQSYILSLPSSQFELIHVDGKQSTWETNVEPRKSIKKKTLLNFSRTFRAIPNSIRDPFKKTLESRLNDPIQKAIDESTRLAETILQPYIENVLSAKRILTTTDRSFLCRDSIELTDYIPELARLENAIQGLYLPVYETYRVIIQQVRETFLSAIRSIQQQEKEIQSSIHTQLTETLQQFCESSKGKIQELDTSALLMSNEEILQSWVNNEIQNSREYISQTLHLFQLSYSFQPGLKLSTTITPHSHSFGDTTLLEYDSVKSEWNTFTTELNTILSTLDHPVYTYFTTHVGKLLEGKILPSSMNTSILIRKHPELSFVIHTYLNQSIFPNSGPQSYSMTELTYKQIYEPWLIECMKHLSDKKYCLTHMALYDLFDTSARENETTYTLHSTLSVYQKHLITLLENRLKKTYCRKVCAGFQVDILDLTL